MIYFYFSKSEGGQESLPDGQWMMDDGTIFTTNN